MSRRSKLWDEETQRIIRERYRHDDEGILYHLKNSRAGGKNYEGKFYKAGDKVKTFKSQDHLQIAIVMDNGRVLKPYVHRVVWFLEHGTQPEIIDHIDRNPLNNAPRNLRESDAKKNACNVGKYKNKASKYKGVSWHKHTKKWVARIRNNDKLISLGYYVNEEDVARAYDKAVDLYFGEYGVKNFLGDYV